MAVTWSGESRTAKPIYDPLTSAQQIGVRLQELVLRNFDAPRSELHHIDNIEGYDRQSANCEGLIIHSFVPVAIGS
jgi:hypothetical protein